MIEKFIEYEKQVRGLSPRTCPQRRLAQGIINSNFKDMETKGEKKKRPSTATVRKASTKGAITQKMMCFRIDAENVEKLEQEQNKGRLINRLLAEHYKS